MKSLKLHYVIGTFIALLFTTQQLYSQCNNTSFGLSQYTILSSQQNVTITDELSGMTYNDATDEFIAVSDGGSIAERHPAGFWSAYGISNYGGSHCNNSRFSDIESITYIKSTGNSHQYAISDERDRALVFVDITDSQTSLTHPSSYLKFTGLDCGGNNGIEGSAYDPASGKMFFATEYSSQKIYSFQVPTNINGQEVAVTEVVNLRNVSGLSTYSTHALDILPNGNIVALVTKPGSGDNGLFDRMLIEINQCGDMLDQFDLEPTIPNTAELEGVAMKGSDIYLIGELGVFYQLTREAPPSIQVVSPGTANSLAGGSSTLVEWTSTNVSGNVEIQLFLNGNFVSTLVNSTSNDGSQSINLPNVTSNTSGYSIRVISKNDAFVFGESSSFTIVAPGTITVISPSTGTSLTPGSAMAIIWSSQNISGNVTIELFQGGSFVTTIASNIFNDGVQSAVVPNVPNGDNYRLKIISVNNNSINDFGGLFSIVNPSITVLNPTSGSTYTSAETINIQWQTVAVIGSVKIELLQGGSFVNSLGDFVVNDGIESVTLPTVSTTASNYSIKVTSLVNPSISDISGTFGIAQPQVFQLTSPTGGEVLASQNSVNVNWINTYSGTVSIELYKANSLVNVLANGVANSGSYPVQLPTVQSTSTDYSIKLILDNDNSIFDISNNFTITQSPTISVMTPTSNDSYFTGNPISVTWSSNVGGNVKIDIFENGSLISNLVSSTPNDNSHTAIIPLNLAGGNSCEIRVTSLTNPTVVGVSDPFQITNNVANASESDLIIQSAGTVVGTANAYTVNGITILNQGGKAVAGTYSVGAYLSTDQTINFADFRIGTVGTFTQTGINQTETASLSFDAASLGLSDGNYVLGFIVDEFDEETEDDEFNNITTNSQLIVVSSSGSGPGNGDCLNVDDNESAESFEVDLGTWTQNTDDDMNWTRSNSSTPSSLTGPSAASDGNYFLFTESSNGNRNKSAVISSSCIDLTNTLSPRFTFDYHMFGSSMGSLQVNIIEASGNTAIAFYQSGDQGNQWKTAAVSMAQYIGQEVTIEIEANLGVSYRSDIGIDNMSIADTQGCSLVGTPCDDGDSCTIGETYDINCNCQGGVYTDLDQDGICVGDDIDDSDPCLPIAGSSCVSCTSTVSGGLTEGFEGNSNNWIQSAYNDNQWLKHSGSTPSSRTGPSSASEGNNYMYVEASYGGYPFKTAIMNSPCLDLSALSTPKLSFDYSMYGTSQGSLIIYVIDMADGASTQIFSQSGNQGRNWRSNQRDLSAFAGKTVQLKIEAITGFGFRSDIAIDNIEVSDTAGDLLADETETRNFVEAASINIEEFGVENELSLYPIPAIDFFTVEYQTAEGIEKATLSLVNASGQIVRTEILQLRDGLVEQKVNVSGLPTGTYYATINSNSDNITKKVFIID